MCGCRRRKCLALNNMCNQNNKEYETICKNISNNNQEYNCNCSCGFDEEDDGFPMNPMYAQSYVPVQVMNNTYMPCSGLHKGTIFPELVSEYYPGQSMAQIQMIRDMNTIGEGCNR